MQLLKEAQIKKIAVALALLFIGLAVIGGIKAYSPVPFWDMWDGYLDFFVKVTNGDTSAWWAQHNEHRIVLARMLFWMDLAWFQGAGWFLIAVNYVLIGASCLVFYGILKERVGSEKNNNLRIISVALVCAWLFSWIQSENFIWGFQSQFILAQLLPLIAFYCLHKSFSMPGRSTVFFVVACIAGIASVGTMANGILALPLMFLLSILLKMGWRKPLLIGLLAICGVGLYFHGYHSIGNHGPLTQGLIQHPIGLVKYTLGYLGGPFYYFTGQGRLGLIMAQLAGFFLMVSSIFFTVKSLRTRLLSSLPLALLTFLLYIAGTAFGTAGGRFALGLETAFSSRYMTPALMAWAALFMLYLPHVFSALNLQKKIITALSFVLVLAMIPQQFKALRSDDGLLFERKLAALALQLRVNDQGQIVNIYPSSEAALALSRIPSERGLSIFGIDPIKNARQAIGSAGSMGSSASCNGGLNVIFPMENESSYVKVQGWLAIPDANSASGVIHFLNERGVIVGYALTKTRGLHVPYFTEGNPRKEFKGYLLADQLGKVITVSSTSPACHWEVAVPLIPLSFTREPVRPELTTVRSTNIVENTGWFGIDFENTKVDGLTVLGSFVHSDSDMGSIMLRLKRGDKVFYRSGPTAGAQSLKINEGVVTSLVLPVVKDWTLINFDNQSLPDEFSVTFTDSGANWGEWSAIALKN